MYVIPTTDLKLLHNIPCDADYRNTLWFDSADLQYNYFANNAKYSYNDFSVIRVNGNTVRVPVNVENIFDVNYIMFRNSNFGTKWFYAFVKSVNYVNNGVAEIVFEIDVIQTWLLDFTMNQCFVEREHSVTDGIGDNIVAESIDLGEYVTDDFNGITGITDTSIIVASTFNKEFQEVDATMYGGTFGGLEFNAFTDYAEATNFIQEASTRGKASEIRSVFQMPTAFVVEKLGHAKTINVNIRRNTEIGNYTPKNNKLYTYPFNFLYITNFQGTSAYYRYEFFSTDYCGFVLTGDMSLSPTVILAPNKYKGTPAVNYDEKMLLTGYPQCSFNTDAFRTWFAQTLANTSLGLIGSAVTAVAGNATLGAYTALNTVAQAMTPSAQTFLAPSQSKGSPNNSALFFCSLLTYGYMHKHITEEYAEIIDNYFTMFGYATKKVKIPNRNSRPKWNYVKTIDSTINGSIPADDEIKICAIHDKGITYWKNPSEVGNYSLDNSPS